ncbi:hypothetical protein DIPPA_32558 [Diplonema papillatum]|nr:hypothetical protein DIPPA_32558 [Diplonema papillatum]
MLRGCGLEGALFVAALAAAAAAPASGQCSAWSSCNGNALSVEDTAAGCRCHCYENFAGPACEACAPGFAGYPQCTEGLWVMVSGDRACARNAEGKKPKESTDFLASLMACQQSCTEKAWCSAVDWYRNTNVCVMYDASCAAPQDSSNGGSHWRQIASSSEVVVFTPIPPTESPDVRCAYRLNTSVADLFYCGDGSACDAASDPATTCCATSGIAQCPLNAPYMCAAKAHTCNDDWCCKPTPQDCAPYGGLRSCSLMDVTPCGLAAEGGSGKVWSGSEDTSSSVDLTGVSAVFANQEAYAAITLTGAVVSWGAAFSGGDSSTVAASLRGIERIFASEKAFAAVTADGRALSWGDDGMTPAKAAAVSASLSSGVVDVAATAYAFAALKSDGSVVAWGQSYYGSDTSGVAALAASGVSSVFATKQAFAAVKADGSAFAWGAPGGGGSTATVAAELAGTPRVVTIASTDAAFAAVRADGSVVTWGHDSRGGDSVSVQAVLQSVEAVYATSTAFAAVTTSGGVVAWGAAGAGGNASTVDAELRAGVARVVGNEAAFAALTAAGSVVAWGNRAYGGELSNPVDDVVQVVATHRALAALHSNGTVVSWGDAEFGGRGSPEGVETLHSSGGAVAAVKTDGRIVVWPEPPTTIGADRIACPASPGNGEGVLSVVSTKGSFAFLTASSRTPAPGNTTDRTPIPSSVTDGSDIYEIYKPVVAWGDPDAGGRVPDAIASNLTCGALYSTSRAFAAVRADGSVAAWGAAGYGGDLAGLEFGGGVSSISATDRAFAALARDGSVATWGDPGFGGSHATVAELLRDGGGAASVAANKYSFCAVTKLQRALVAWGDTNDGGDASPVSGTTGVSAVYSTDQAYAAVTDAGSCATWGSAFFGGDSQTVSTQLAAAVAAVYSTSSAFAALKADGSVTAWGSASGGGDAASVATALTGGVESVVATDSAFAAIKHSGERSVVAWGLAREGGDATSVAALLEVGVEALYATRFAFAARKSDGTVVAWGDANAGGNASTVAGSLRDVVEVYANDGAFAAVTENGTVVAWGDAASGGDVTGNEELENVTVVYATTKAFAALRLDGSVVAWGAARWGGDEGGALPSGQRAVYSTEFAFAALVPCGIGSKLREIGEGACLDETGERYVEAKSEQSDRAGCLQLLLEFSPPARGATWWPDAPGVKDGFGGCYIAFEPGSNVSSPAWLEFPSADTARIPRRASGSVAYGDGHFGMDCVAADPINYIPPPTPTPSTAAPTPVPTLTPDGLYATWVLAGSSASCEYNLEDVTPLTSSSDTTRDSCLATCTGFCTGVEYHSMTQTCRRYAALCSNPLTRGLGYETWVKMTGAGPGGSVVSWGSWEAGGGDGTVAAALGRGVLAVHGNSGAFAALKTDGTVVTWGAAAAGGDSSTVAAVLARGMSAGVVSLASTAAAFAALLSDQTVIAWGNRTGGGQTSSVAAQLVGIRQVYAGAEAFVAVKSTGIVAWGPAESGGDASTVASLVSARTLRGLEKTRSAFAALLTSSNAVVTWGHADEGGDSTSVQALFAAPAGVTVAALSATDTAFAAVREDGSVVAWGAGGGGGDASTVAALLAGGVRSVAATGGAFAALKDDGTVVCWGSADAGGTPSRAAATARVRQLAASGGAFAALTADGNVLAWGSGAHGGNRERTSGGFEAVFGAPSGFVGVLANGTAETWGAGGGGATEPDLRALKWLRATGEAFAAVDAAGRVQAWGSAAAGGNLTAEAAQQLHAPVASLAGTGAAFAALMPTAELVVAVPPGSGLDRCAVSRWVASDASRCVDGRDAVGAACGGAAEQPHHCAFSPATSAYTCAACPAAGASPAPATRPPPTGVTASPTALPATAGQRVVVCAAATGRSTGQAADEYLVISCAAGGAVRVQAAAYGRATCAGELCFGAAAAGGACSLEVPCVADVTEALRQQCDGRSGCNLNATSPDLPAACRSLGEGVAAYLDVQFSCEAVICERESTTEWGRPTGQVADGSWEASCLGGTEIVVDRAVFGRQSCKGHLCYASPPNANCGTSTCAADVTDRIKSECHGLQTCRVTASPALLSNPCPQENKYLEVYYTCQPSPETVRWGACKTREYAYYREYKKSSVASRDECVSLLRALSPPARAALYWPGNGCYLQVDAGDEGIELPGSWDSTDSRDTYGGPRNAKGTDLLVGGSPEAGMEDAECVVLPAMPDQTPAPDGGAAGTPPVAGAGSGWCGDAATAEETCLEASNAYYCDGFCCCEEQRGWVCESATGRCRYGSSGDTPLPVPTAGSGTGTNAPLTPRPASLATFAPGLNPGAEVSGTHSESKLWLYILIVVLVVLCVASVAGAFLCGRRAKAGEALLPLDERMSPILEMAKREAQQEYYEPGVKFSPPETMKSLAQETEVSFKEAVESIAPDPNYQHYDFYGDHDYSTPLGSYRPEPEQEAANDHGDDREGVFFEQRPKTPTYPPEMLAYYPRGGVTDGKELPPLHTDAVPDRSALPPPVMLSPVCKSPLMRSPRVRESPNSAVRTPSHRLRTQWEEPVTELEV